MDNSKRWIGLVSAMGIVMAVFGCAQPKVGMQDGRLKPCPDSPNCVSSQATDKTHQVAPLTYTGAKEDAHAALLSVLAAMPRCKVVTDSGDYIHATFTSLVFRFADDVEFYFDETGGTIQIRSASRMGYSDLGVNRKRVAEIRRLFEKQIAPR